MEPTKAVKTGRDERGRFTEGNPGGPGRPPGVPALVDELKAMLHEDREAFARVARQKLIEGDGRMWQLLLDRAWPPKQEVELSGAGGGAVTFCWAETDSGEPTN